MRALAGHPSSALVSCSLAAFPQVKVVWSRSHIGQAQIGHKGFHSGPSRTMLLLSPDGVTSPGDQTGSLGCL